MNQRGNQKIINSSVVIQRRFRYRDKMALGGRMTEFERIWKAVVVA
jgi:hypothetical protein